MCSKTFKFKLKTFSNTKIAMISSIIIYSVVISTCFCDTNFMFGRFETPIGSGGLDHDAYLKEMGYSTELREYFMKHQFIIEFSKAGSQFTINYEKGVKRKSFTFELGNEFNEVFLGGRVCKAIYLIPQPNKLVQNLNCGDLKSFGTAEFTLDGMTLKRTANDKTSVQHFKRS